MHLSPAARIALAAIRLYQRWLSPYKSYGLPTAVFTAAAAAWVSATF
ncbi:hypothetical protein [Neisseria canis]|nr:hypothetical protein [Neisseria canis]